MKETKTKILADFLRRSAERRFKAGVLRRSELVMALADADKQARSLARTKAFRHLFGEQLKSLIRQVEAEDSKRPSQSN